MATRSRIPLPTPETMTPAQLAVYRAMEATPRGGAGGPLLVALHRPEFADKLQKLGEQLRFNTRFPKRISEMVILLVGRHWSSQFVWFVHEPIARAAGIADDVMEDLRHGRQPQFAHPEDLEVYQYCTELLKTGFVGLEAYNRIVQRWGAPGVVELTGLVGYYCMNSLSINAHDLFPEGEPLPLP